MSLTYQNHPALGHHTIDTSQGLPILPRVRGCTLLSQRFPWVRVPPSFWGCPHTPLPPPC